MVYSFIGSAVGGNRIRIGDIDNLTIRGYAVDQLQISAGNRVLHAFQVCDFNRLLSSIQFRWLQTSLISGPNPKDIWSMDDVLVTYEPEEGMTVDLLRDSFDEEQLK